jgi:hypothetical protein
MWRRVTVLVVGALLVTGGWVVADKWGDRRIAACERRSSRLSALGLLQRQPDGFQPVSSFFGCDFDRVVAYASRQFATNGPAVDTLYGHVAGEVDEQAVSAFYRQVLKDGGWQISARPAAPGPNAASLCARKELPFGKTYINLSFQVVGMYELAAADAADAGAVCRW